MHDVRKCCFFIDLCEHVHKHDTFNLLALCVKYNGPFLLILPMDSTSLKDILAAE